MVLEMEGIVAEVHSVFNEDFMAIAHDFHCINFQLLQCTRLIHTWLEDIWSELVVMGCAVCARSLSHGNFMGNYDGTECRKWFTPPWVV